MTEVRNPREGRVIRVAGPVVGVIDLVDVRLFDVVHVGEMGLVGEVIRLSGNLTTVQVYEETAGLRVGEPVTNTGAPLVVQLGPGLLGCIYDGLQRPLPDLAALSGDFIDRGMSAFPVSREVRWHFTPFIRAGDGVSSGDIIGAVAETPAIEHRVMVPPGISGKIAWIESGDFTVDDVVAVVEMTGQQHEIRLVQAWPVRQPRPFHARLELPAPMVTGTRVMDAFFPVAKGGTAIVPGGFGTGKTVIEQSLARWANVDVVVYVGCGERGNEIADVLEEFPRIADPYSGLPLMNRTVLIANTSNMPVAAREASIYTGITIGEYYRDMGYDVLLLADSTSRWGEALREISGRLEEIPGEEGYPAYLATRLSEFYERSGSVYSLGRRLSNDDAGPERPLGSLTLIGAVSPPGGDFSEPITQSSMTVVGALWALDYKLSRRRHFPAVSWTQSYTLYDLKRWYGDHVAADWNDLIREGMALLQRADELQEIVQLVGPEALSEFEHLLLLIARMIQEDFLQQSLFEEHDRFCPLEKTYWMLKTLLNYYRRSRAALEDGMSLEALRSLPQVERISRMKEVPPDRAVEELRALNDLVSRAFAEPGES